MKTSKIQYNANNAKAFRNTMGAFLNAVRVMDEQLYLKQKEQSATKTLIASCEDKLTKLAEGTFVGSKSVTIESVQADMAKYEADLKVIEDNYAAMREKQDKRKADAIALVPDCIVSEYEKWVAGDENTYVQSLCDWLTKNGCESVTADKVSFLPVFNVRFVKGKTAIKQGTHIVADKRSYKEHLCTVIAEDMVNSSAINVNKYTVKIEDKKSNK